MWILSRQAVFRKKHFYVSITFLTKTTERTVIANDLPNDYGYYSTYDTLRNS